MSNMIAADSTGGTITAPAPSSRPNLPASPTLTNPDMILPDYDRSPSPVGLDDPMQSPLLMWRGAQDAQGSERTNPTYNKQFQQFQPLSGASPTTPIIYGNGTMLSDIGEVTEAESAPGRASPHRQRYGPATHNAPGLKADDSEGDAALRSSPTIGKGPGSLGGVKKRAKAAQRERRSSTDSNSTITDHDQPPIVVEFDDTVSVGDSVFQGDDEESLASSYVDDTSLVDGPSFSYPQFARDSGQKYTTAQLSRRAEHILANAKKRLTHMEGNLTRARTSLLVVGPTSSDSNASTPSPPIARASSAFTMATSGLPSPASSHRRMSSDNALRIGIPIKVYPQRSSTALDVASGPRQQVLTISKSADQLHGQYNRQRASYIMRDGSLEPLGEDDVSQPARQAGLSIMNRYSSINSPTFGVPEEHVLSRSASTSQMRNIKDQVQDLKGKISSLREQARADSLKRQSMQSLRTPSPFTYAHTNQWYGTSVEDSGPQSQASNPEISPLSEDTSAEYTPRNSRFETPSQGDSDGISPVGTADPLKGDGTSRHEFYSTDAVSLDTGSNAEDEDVVTENGDVEEEEECADTGEESKYEDALGDDYDLVSEGGDSIYHESVQHPISHEDREDAFDYEHFFLHSAMGTISQRMERRGSDASFGSEDSVETTRGPVAGDIEPPTRTRRGSETSISSTDTFATAEERVASRQDSVEFDIDDENDEGQGESIDEEDGEDRGEEEDQIDHEAFPILPTSIDVVERPDTPPTAKRATFAGMGSPPVTVPHADQRASRPELLHSAVRRPVSSGGATRAHATSVSSFESTGTTRSFPLVNRNSRSSSSGVPTPEGGSSDPEAKTRVSSPLSEWGSQNGSAANGEHKHGISLHSPGRAASLIEESGTTAVMETLHRDDQFLVERLVASLGRCVLGMTEHSRASVEARMYRHRIDAARKILEGLESA